MRNLSILHPYEGGVSNNSLLARAPQYPRCVGHAILISHVVSQFVLWAQGAEESYLTITLAKFIAQIDLVFKIQNNERDWTKHHAI